MSPWVVAWACLAGFVLYRHWRRGWGVGLLLTYIFSFAALHWLAPLLHLLPWFEPMRGDLTAEGLRQSTFAMAGFAVGLELLTLGRRRSTDPDEVVEDTDRAAVTGLINLYLVVGVVLYAVALMGGRLPIIAAIISTGSTLVSVSVGLKCWDAWRSRHYGSMWLWLAITTIFPLVTVLTQGFLGFGFVAVLIVVSLVASFQRVRWVSAVGAVFLIYGCLSIYVTYMRDRTDIRDVVWGGQRAGMRIAQLQETFRTAEWFDVWNIEHLKRVDKRLNQDHLIGSAVVYLEEGNARYAQGSTLVDAVIALVPRALWPNKPTVAGSGDIVTTYTGIRFVFGTSVGVGQVMELHVNFGTPGVVLGFMVFGAIVGLVDRRAAKHLVQGDISSFALWYMPGLSLLQVGGSLAEVTATAAASSALVVIVNRLRRPETRGTHIVAARDSSAAVERGSEVVP